MNLSWVSISGFLILLVACQGSNFSRDHVSVWFNPYIFPEDALPFEGYNEQDIIQMVATISTQFSKIVMDPVEPQNETSKNMIPVAIAKFNKFYRTFGQPPVELTLSFKFSQRADFLSNLNFAFKLSNKANSLYKGSVKRIMLDYTEFNIESLLSQVDFVEKAQREIDKAPYQYEFGIYLSCLECAKVRQLGGILRRFRFAIFRRFPVETSSSSNFKTFLAKTKIDIEDCTEKFVSTLGKQVSIHFSIMRVDTLANQKQNITGFVTFWEKMNAWAVRRNIRIVLYEAFDNFRKRDSQSSTTSAGWWKAKGVEDRTYFVLEEKKLQESHKPPEISAYNPEGLEKIKLFPGFSKNNVMVTFDSKVSHEEEEEYDETVVFNMVNVIAAKFRKIILLPTSSSRYSNGKMGALLVLGIATWNKLHSNGSLPLEVVLQYSLDDMDHPSEQNSFDITMILANQANSIYENTVKQIFLRLTNSNLNSSSSNNILKELLNVRRVNFKECKFQYKFGIAVPYQICGIPGQRRSELEPFMKLLPFIDDIILYDYPSEKMLSLGKDSYFRMRVKHFDWCLENLKKSKISIQPYLEMSWSMLIERRGVIDLTQNAIDLVNFWITGNNWAVSRNVTVILSDAIDGYSRDDYYVRKSGWWYSLYQKGYPRNYVFIERSEEVKSFFDLDALYEMQRKDGITILVTIAIILITYIKMYFCQL